ncbi:MAG: DUF718 domain-containing protein [bacterium]
MSKYMNVIRFRVKPEFKDVIVSKFAEFEIPSGYQMGRLIQTGEFTYCSVGEWDNQESLINARPAMIGFLDSVRHMLEEISPELGVTDPVSGPVVQEQ